MVIYKSFNNDKLVELVKVGGIGAIPTDTVYGLVCSVSDREAVEKIYEIKGRDDKRPLIVLLSSLKDLGRFGVKLSDAQRNFLMKNWPEKISVILPVDDEDFGYLSRGTGSIAFRVPDDNKLIAFLQKTGPLVAPSANPQDQKTATDIDEIMDYFIGEIDFVVDGGLLQGTASTLVDLTSKNPKVLRQGDANVQDV